MTAFKLTREQEQRLINFALDQLIGDLLGPRRVLAPRNGHAPTNGHAPRLAAVIKPRKGWSAARRRAFSAKMVKVWNQKRKPKPEPRRSSAIRAQRERSAKLLARYDADTPRPGTIAGRGLGALVRRGYLKSSGDGYVRTAKPYTP